MRDEGGHEGGGGDKGRYETPNIREEETIGGGGDKRGYEDEGDRISDKDKDKRVGGYNRIRMRMR